MYEQEFEDIIIPVYYTFDKEGTILDEESMKKLFEEKLEKVKKEIDKYKTK